MEELEDDLYWARMHFGWNFALAIVRRRPEAIVYIPLGVLDGTVCAEAVRQNGWLLCFVPSPLQTPSLCVLAVLQNKKMLRAVPEDRRDLVAAVALRILASGRKRQKLKNN